MCRALLFVFLLGSFFSATAQDLAPSQYCQKLIDSGIVYKTQKRYPQAFKSYAKAELIAQNNNFYKKSCEIKNRIGNAYSDLSNFGEALSYYREGLKIARAHDKAKNQIAILLNNIGWLYIRQENIEKALVFYEQAYEMARANDSAYNIVLVGINLSDSYNKLKQPAKSLKYLNEIKPYPKSDLFQQVWTVNYAESLFLQGHIAEAQKMAMELLEKTREQKTGVCHLCVMELLSK